MKPLFVAIALCALAAGCESGVDFVGKVNIPTDAQKSTSGVPLAVYAQITLPETSNPDHIIFLGSICQPLVDVLSFDENDMEFGCSVSGSATVSAWLIPTDVASCDQAPRSLSSLPDVTRAVASATGLFPVKQHGGLNAHGCQDAEVHYELTLEATK